MQIEYLLKAILYDLFVILMIFSVSEVTNIWVDVMGTDDKLYTVQTNSKSHRTMPPYDHRPRRPGARPHLRQRYHCLCGRAMGAALDHHDTSRVALALARTRLMAAKYPYYLLADSPEGVKKEAELTGKSAPGLHRLKGTSKRASSTSGCPTSP